MSAASKRRAKAKNSFTCAADTIGPVTRGMALFALTRGQFSMIDMIQHVLACVGPAAVSVWTWAIADYEVEVFEALLVDERITGARLVVDYSASKRNTDLLTRWERRFGTGSVRVCKNHAKIARVWTADTRVLLRGSCNLNLNPRFEQIDVTEGGADFELVGEIEEAMKVLPLKQCSHADAQAASGLEDAFGEPVLAAFRGLPVWKP